MPNVARDRDPGESKRLAAEHTSLMRRLVLHGANLSVLVEKLELTADELLGVEDGPRTDGPATAG